MGASRAHLAAPPESSRTAKVVDGRFQLVRHARSGGMGEVFVAEDLSREGATVAVKILSTTRPLIVERFLREAQILSELDHPAIVRHLAHGMHEGEPWLAMEWLEGRTLSDRLKTGMLSVRETISIGTRIAEALAQVHARGIVHRDVKPSNIVLEGNSVNRAVLLDFGIAHVLEAEGDLTRTGDLLGTPGYMAPEQAQGREVDARVDVFALGCVLYRCLSGRPPFEGADPLAVAIKVLLDEAPRLRDLVPGVPRALDDLVARMIARSKDDRPSDGAAVARALVRIDGEDTGTICAPPSGTRLLGGDERRVYSIVVARPSDWEPSLAAMAALRDVLEEPIGLAGGVLDVLADGSVVVTVAGGAPSDVALRAARCALLVRRELWDAAVVVSTGHAVSTGNAPLGSLVDAAVYRLGDATGPILLDRTSAALLESRFEIEALSSDAPRLRGERGTASARTLLGRPTPFVGRARELAILDATLEHCIDESVAQLVVVTGDAGMGKTRLREEFLRRARDTRAWLAAGDVLTKGSALAIIGQLLRSAFGFQPSDGVARRRRRVKSAIEALGIPDVALTAAFLGEICDAPSDEEEAAVELAAARRDPQILATRSRIAFEALVRAECARGPLIIVVDDLHWVDAASIKLLGDVVRSASSALLVVAFSRPEGLTALPRGLSDRAQEVRLLELSRRASMELVKNVLGVAGEQAEALAARSQGNAFFLEELIRAVAEGKSDLPDTVVAMIEARIAELDATSRKVLRAASIFGHDATAAGIRALMGGEERDVEAFAERLVRSEYLTKADSGAYRFRHAIVREAAYAMLTDEDRTLGHRLAGEHLESIGDTPPIVLAEHFALGEEKDRARALFGLAGSQALACGDLVAAIALADRAADGATGGALADLLMLKADAKIWASDPSALDDAEGALALVQPGTTTWFRASTAILFASGRVAAFMKVAQTVQAVRACDVLEADVLAASAAVRCYALGTWMLSLLGMYDLARELHAKGRALEDTIDDFSRGWLGVSTFFVCKYEGRDPWQAYLSIKKAKEDFRRVGDVRLVELARILEGTTLVELGAFAEARAVLEAALETCEELRLEVARADCKRWLGHALEGLGKQDQAALLFARAENEPTSNLIYRASARAARGWLIAERGALDEGAACVASAVAELSFAPSHRAHALAWLARIELRRGGVDAAKEAAERAKATMDAFRSIAFGEATVHVALVEVYEALGDHERAAHARAEGRAAIERRASVIGDESYRASFCALAENARLLSRDA